jgi:hypothetical protein
MAKSDTGNGDTTGHPTADKLLHILGVARSEKTVQPSAKRTHDARERSRQARVKAQRDRKERGK